MLPLTKDTTDNYVDAIIGDSAAADAKLAAAVKQFMLALLVAGAEDAAEEYALDLTMHVTNPLVMEFVARYSGLLSRRANDTIRESVRSALVEGLTQGEAGRVLKDRIAVAMGGERIAGTNKFQGGKVFARRVEMITRTETARAQNAGRNEQVKEAGASRKVWQAYDEACEWCASIDGMTVEIADDFFPKGSTLDIGTDDKPQIMKFDYCDVGYPPAHPACRCAAVYEFD